MPDIKWGIIDYYGQKKLSYPYVRQAYQPLLVSLAHKKRRWKAGEMFSADIHVTNDFHRVYQGLKLTWWIKNARGEICNTGEMMIDAEADSSKLSHTISWLVEGDLETFSIELRLEQNGILLSSNHYDLLIGDQDKAKEECQKLYQEMNAQTSAYGKNYYKYFPELWKLE